MGEEELTQRPARNASRRSVHVATQKLVRSDAGGRKGAKDGNKISQVSCDQFSPSVSKTSARSILRSHAKTLTKLLLIDLQTLAVADYFIETEAKTRVKP